MLTQSLWEGPAEDVNQVSRSQRDQPCGAFMDGAQNVCSAIFTHTLFSLLID